MLEKGAVTLKRFYFEAFGILAEKEELKKIETLIKQLAKRELDEAFEKKDFGFFVNTLSKIYENPNLLSYGADKSFEKLFEDKAISESFIKSKKKEVLELLGETAKKDYTLDKKQQETWQLWALMSFFVKRVGFRLDYYKPITGQQFLAQPSFTRISNSWISLKKNLTAEKVKQTKWLPIDKKIVYRERNEFINDLKKEIARRRVIIEWFRSGKTFAEFAEVAIEKFKLNRRTNTKLLTFAKQWSHSGIANLVSTEFYPIITSGIDKITCKSFVEISEQDFETMKKENNEKNETLIKSFKIEIEVYILSKKRF